MNRSRKIEVLNWLLFSEFNNQFNKCFAPESVFYCVWNIDIVSNLAAKIFSWCGDNFLFDSFEERRYLYLRALRRKCICIWELCGENVQRQAADLAELTPSPGEGRRGEGGKGRKGRRMLIILMCPAADLPIAGLFSGASCNDITREPQMQSLLISRCYSWSVAFHMPASNEGSFSWCRNM